MKDDFFGKRVVIMGLGLYSLGSGISAAKFFIAREAKVVVTDLKSRKELAAQIKSVMKFYKFKIQNSKSKIHKPEFILGRHRKEDFSRADIVMKNPAVRVGSPYLKIARKHGAEIMTDISLFFALCACPIIGITGTRGKSTTTTLVYEILKAAGYETYLGGNIQISPLSFINKVETQNFASLQNLLPVLLPFRAGEEWKGGVGWSESEEFTPSRSPFIRGRKLVVLELSSWMLESTGEAKVSPPVALITNVMPDHLNTYAGMADYIAAKENIFRWQKGGDIAILNRDNKITAKMGASVRARRFWFGVKYFSDENGCFVKNGKMSFRVNGLVKNICAISDIKLPGEHNLQNVLAAACLASALGIPPSVVGGTIKKFRGIPNRLEFIREIRGVKFYNDTTATTPDAVIAALRALNRPGKIVLIAGGADKNLKFTEMARELKKQKVRIVMFPGRATEKITAEFQKIHYHAVSQPVRDMKSAVSLARSLAHRGNIILLSPGAASFGLFQNEFDRGCQFVKIVKEIS